MLRQSRKRTNTRGWLLTGGTVSHCLLEYWPVLLVELNRSVCLSLSVSEQLRSPGSTVRLQDGMLLNCSCPWNGKLIMVSWTREVYSNPFAVYHPSYGVNFAAAYDGRVEFINASAMDGSIRIMNVTEDDVGLYHCSVQTFPQGSWTKDMLVLKQGITPRHSIWLLDNISAGFWLFWSP